MLNIALSAGVPLNCVWFSNTGLLIIGDNPGKKDSYCVWNAITLQRVDERSVSVSQTKHSPHGVRKSERCIRCLWQGRRELIPSRKLEFLPFSPVNPISSSSAHGIYGDKRAMYTYKTATANRMYNKVQGCTFHLFRHCWWVVDNVHLILLAVWEFLCYGSPYYGLCEVVDVAALDDESWLYVDKKKLVVCSAVSPKEGEGCLLRPACVLWCSFSPDGSRLATCTSDGFINLWNVDTCHIYERFKSNIETSSAACWWSSHYLFVFWLTDETPSLIKYPVDEEGKIGVSQQELVSLDHVAIEFASFSGIVDFSEGLLSFECGGTKPVKVVDVQIEPPMIVCLPGIEPLMKMAVSRGAIFVLGVGNKCWLWKRDEVNSVVYEVFVSSYPHDNIVLTPHSGDCCFNNDMRFAMVSFTQLSRRFFVTIDLDSGSIRKSNVDTTNELQPSSCQALKLFCTGTNALLITQNDIEIFETMSWKLLGCSVQPDLTDHALFHSRLSPLGNIVAIPLVNGGVEFIDYPCQNSRTLDVCGRTESGLKWRSKTPPSLR